MRLTGVRRALQGRRPSASTVISIIALFAALASSATAAIVITGKNIKNETITSADIKNHSIKAKDLASAAVGVKGEKGDTGPQGEVGTQGPAGADGAPGPTGPSCVDELGREACAGPPGKTGDTGSPGLPCTEIYGEDCKGKDGTNGKDGAPGPNSVRLVTEVAIGADGACATGTNYNPGSDFKVVKVGATSCRIVLLPSSDKEELAANANTKLGTATLTNLGAGSPELGGGAAARQGIDENPELIGRDTAVQSADESQATAAPLPWIVGGTAARQGVDENPELISGDAAKQKIDDKPELIGGDRSTERIGGEKPRPRKPTPPTLVSVTYEPISVTDGRGRTVQVPSFVVEFFDVLGQPSAGAATVTLYTILS